MTDILRTNVLSRFSCLGDRCEDTCCQKWSMQVDEATIERYRQEAPELLEAVESSPESPWIMRKDAATGFCVKLEGGLCAIHKQYGDRFLGDACSFYPRVTRALGEQVVMTATMSCPEIVRLALAEEHAGAVTPASVDRLPHHVKNYLPDGVTPADALAIHQAFLHATEDTQTSAEHIFLRIASASRSLERIDKKSWPQMAAFYLAHADTRLPPAERDAADPFNLLHALCGLIVASHKPLSDRLKQTIADMEKTLAVTLDWEQVQIRTTPQSLSAYQKIQALWKEKAAEKFSPVLRRWLQMQLSTSLYPYSGLGHALEERITIIGVRLATIKLALTCSYGICGAELPQDVVIRVIQSVSRFLDHLGDPDFSLKIYTETGWIKEKRMRGLLET